MTLANLLSFFPRIKLVDPLQHDSLFSIIDQAPLSSEKLQISFERKPDFFQYLKLQGMLGLVFYFTNQDGTPHGFAVSTFRQMKWKHNPLCLGYTSDLRTTSKLDRVARLEWRRFYAKAISHSMEIEEFHNCSGFFTAVWNENLNAQKALVQKKRPQDVTYKPVTQYESHALWGRWYPMFQSEGHIRKIKKNEISIVFKTLCESGELDWEKSDLENTLSLLGVSINDFFVLEKNNELKAFVLPASTGRMKQTIIKKWPKSLEWSAKILPFIGKRKIELNKPLEILQLMFFRSLDKNPSDLYNFADYFWLQNAKKSSDQQFHILNVSVWSSYEFVKKGYLSSTISGTLYKVEADQVLPEFNEINDFSNLEVGLL